MPRGIKEIGTIRNHLGHSLLADIELADLPECVSVLRVARKGKHYEDPLETIEDFAAVACTWLIADPEIEGIFEEAFKRVLAKHRA